MPVFISLLIYVVLSCQSASADQVNALIPAVVENDTLHALVQDTSGTTIATRFSPPSGFTRASLSDQSFEAFLRKLPLKPTGSKVIQYDGQFKYRQDVHAAVIDIDVGQRDLQQCADAVMRLRAEYLWSQQAFDDITFQFTNGFPAPYRRWRAGERIRVRGNDVSWGPQGKIDTTYQQFRKYLNMVFAYAGTLSLAKELESRPIEEIQIGDVFIQGGSPGHAVIVVDLARSNTSGEVMVLLAQSYMPAQDIHVLRNQKRVDDWYLINENTRVINTPEWIFSATDLKHF